MNPYLNAGIKLLKTDFKPNVITLTREIVSRNISCFFQCVGIPEREWYVGDRYKVSSMKIPQLIEAFFNCPKWKHEEAANWFDEQLNRFFGIDVYKTPFDTSRGWEIYQNCLLLRMEDLDRLNVINQFLDIKMPKKEVNRAEDHWYKDIYREFVKQIRVDNSYLDTAYGSKYMRHFYSDQERDIFRKRWANGL